MTGGSGAPAALPHLALAERGWRGPVYSSHAIINNDFLQVAGKSAEGVVAPASPMVVADQLPAADPIKASVTEFRRLYQKANGEAALNPFAGYAYDSFLVMFDALKRTIAAGATPGTPQFHLALRDALATTHELVGTQAVYTFKPGQRFGADARARVLVTLHGGRWELIK